MTLWIFMPTKLPVCGGAWRTGWCMSGGRWRRRRGWWTGSGFLVIGRGWRDGSVWRASGIRWTGWRRRASISARAPAAGRARWRAAGSGWGATAEAGAEQEQRIMRMDGIFPAMHEAAAAVEGGSLAAMDHLLDGLWDFAQDG